MRKINKILFAACISISIASCATNTNQIEQFDKTTKLQGKSLSPKQKTKFCSKFKTNKNEHKQQITNILWKQASNRKNNQITKKYIRDNWFTFVNAKDPSIFGQEFIDVRNTTLLNIRYAANIKCAWVNQPAH